MVQSVFSSIFHLFVCCCCSKSTLVENAPLGGLTTRVRFAYYTQGCSAALAH